MEAPKNRSAVPMKAASSNETMIVSVLGDNLFKLSSLNLPAKVGKNS